MGEITNVILKCLKRDRNSQKALYTYLLPYLKAVARRYLRESNYSKDALQESFVIIFRSLHKYDSNKGDIIKWTTRIVINVCLNINNRLIKKSVEYDNKYHDIKLESAVDTRLEIEEVLSQLKSMPSKYYNVFNLYIIEGYKHAEIAELLGLSVELSRKRLSRAKAWVESNLEMNKKYE